MYVSARSCKHHAIKLTVSFHSFSQQSIQSIGKFIPHCSSNIDTCSIEDVQPIRTQEWRLRPHDCVLEQGMAWAPSQGLDFLKIFLRSVSSNALHMRSCVSGNGLYLFSYPAQLARPLLSPWFRRCASRWQIDIWLWCCWNLQIAEVSSKYSLRLGAWPHNGKMPLQLLCGLLLFLLKCKVKKVYNLGPDPTTATCLFNCCVASFFFFSSFSFFFSSSLFFFFTSLSPLFFTVDEDDPAEVPEAQQSQSHNLCMTSAL